MINQLTPFFLFMELILQQSNLLHRMLLMLCRVFWTARCRRSRKVRVAKTRSIRAQAYSLSLKFKIVLVWWMFIYIYKFVVLPRFGYWNLLILELLTVLLSQIDKLLKNNYIINEMFALNSLNDLYLFALNYFTLKWDKVIHATFERHLVEVFSRLFLAGSFNGACYCHLTMHRFPVEANRRFRIRFEVASLFTALVSEK